MRVEIEREGVKYHCDTEEQLKAFLDAGWTKVEEKKTTTTKKTTVKK